MHEFRHASVYPSTHLGAILRQCAPWLLIFLVTFLAYSPALNGGLLMDDAEHIRRPDLQTLAGLGRIWFEFGATPHYYPLLNTAFWLEHRLWGDAVLGYHAANIALHALAACLVVHLMRRVQLPGALLGGLVFALHPVCVESVAWIVEQKNTLSGVFFLGSAVVYLRFDRERRLPAYWLAFGLFVAALLTKSVTATLPPSLLVIFWWQRGRLGWRRDIVPLLPWFGAGIGMGLLSAWFERTYSHASGAAFDLGIVERCLVAGRAIWFYASTALWPVDLVFIPPRWQIDAAAALQYAFPLGVVLVIGGLGAFAYRSRGPLAAALLYVGNLFPVLGFLNINWFNFSYVADHFQYLALIALIASFTAGVALLVQRLPAWWTRPSLGPAALLVGTLGWLTWHQSATYRDAETLYTTTLGRNPAAWLAQNNLGVIFEDRPDGLPRAVEHYRAAIRLKPDHARAHNNLGNALLQMGQTDEAIAMFLRSLELQSAVPEVHANLGLALLRARRPQEALASFERALHLAPDTVPALLGRAEVLATTPGRTTEAVAALYEAVALAPDAPRIRETLAALLASLPGRLDEAIAQYEEAIRLEPAAAVAHNNLGTALAASPDRQPEAIRAFETAVRLQPDYIEARYNLAALLSEIPGRIGEAAGHLEKVIQLAPYDADARTRLAVILLRIPGRTDDAVRQLERVVQLQPTSPQARVNLASILVRQPDRVEEAKYHIREALRLRPGFAPALELARQMSPQ
ncbi:MAG: tetratricopeptide repeat protein [Opitutaceae bacterium]|nr:tetratricopeptide repeat protein [Opitutaceae bacterium]